MRLYIKTVAKLLGVSTNTIRYYERIGLISPKRDEENDYRYYDDIDLGLLIRAKFYNNLGLSFNDVQTIIDEVPLETATLRLRENLQSSREEMTYRQYLHGHAERFLAEVESLERKKGKYFYKTRPAMLILRYGEMEDIEENVELQRMMSVMLSHMGIVKPFYYINLEGVAKENSAALSIEWKDAEYLQIPASPYLSYQPEEKCVYTVFESDDKIGLENPLLPFEGYHGSLDMKQFVCGNLLLSFKKGDTRRYYVDAWIPVGK